MSGKIVVAAFTIAGFLGGLAAGWLGFDDRANEFDSTIVKFNADRTTVCVDRAEDSCGVAVIEGSDASALEEGSVVKVREFWLDADGDKVLAFHIRPN